MLNYGNIIWWFNIQGQADGTEGLTLSVSQSVSLKTYKEIVAVSEARNENKTPNPIKPVSIATFAQHTTALAVVLKDQKKHYANSNKWQDVFDHNFKDLQKHVKRRATRVKEDNYKE